MLCLCDHTAHAVYASGVALLRYATVDEERAAFAACEVSAPLRNQVRVWRCYRDMRPLLAVAGNLSLRALVNPLATSDPGLLLPALLRGADLPVHFLAPSKRVRCRAAGVIERRLLRDVPEGSFRVCDRSHGQVLLPSPELHLLLRASELDALDLALLVCEYCGTYWTRPDLRRGLVKRPQPMTSRARILEYLDRVPRGVRGVARLRQAVDLGFDGSASPRESGLALLQTYRDGDAGFGLPRPVLNERVELSRAAQAYARWPEATPDERWPGTMVCAEYESDLDHGGGDDPRALQKRKRDENRRRALEEDGFTVEAIFADDLRDVAAVERLMKRLARDLGVRPNWAPVAGWLEPLRRRLVGYRCVI